MEKKFIVTAFGLDRPGIVADVTQLIYENGCNLEDSTMARLEDEFVMIFLCSGRGEGLEEHLSKACRRLEREKGISAFLRSLESHKVPQKKPLPQKKPFSTSTLHIEGIDQAGIVYKVSKYLAEHHVNIADLHSKLMFSPESGTAIYTIEMHIEIPEGTPMENLEKGLTQIGDELHVDITLLTQ
jgi:glycine cleavage system transcriptional repressor